jgi:hypothetical protein
MVLRGVRSDGRFYVLFLGNCVSAGGRPPKDGREAKNTTTRARAFKEPVRVSNPVPSKTCNAEPTVVAGSEHHAREVLTNQKVQSLRQTGQQMTKPPTTRGLFCADWLKQRLSLRSLTRGPRFLRPSECYPDHLHHRPRPIRLSFVWSSAPHPLQTRTPTCRVDVRPDNLSRVGLLGSQVLPVEDVRVATVDAQRPAATAPAHEDALVRWPIARKTTEL